MRPDWEPAGHRIVFEAGGRHWMPAWTADGKAILATAAVRQSLQSRLVLVELDGSAVIDTGLKGAHGRQVPLTATP